MKKLTFLLLLTIAALATIASPNLVLAHEHQVFKIGNAYYQFVVGSLNEPVTVDDKTGVDLRVSQVLAPKPNTAETPGTPASESATPLPPIRRGFSGWGIYWRDFSAEEKKLYENWKRPAGPLRVGLQAGHWKNSEAPEELSALKRSGGGAVGGGKSEWEVVLEIARKTKITLEARGVVVDLLPATVPPDYVTDAFVSIHADGNNNSTVSGFKISGPRRDFSGRADFLVSTLYESYGEATGLKRDPNVTRRMSGYYAFNWRRYEHAVHPLTPSAIVETGFMTSLADRAVII